MDIIQPHPPISIYLGREGRPDYVKNKMNLVLKDGDPNKIFLDFSKFEHIGIFGKSGSGKSYALGVLIEESIIQENAFATIVIDPLGNFTTMEIANRTGEIAKWNRDLNRNELDQKIIKENQLKIRKKVRIAIPAESIEYFDPSMYDEIFSVNIKNLDDDLFCYAFGMKSTDPMVSLLVNARKMLKSRKKPYTIRQLIGQIRLGSGHHATQDALVRKLEILESLNLISNDAPEVYNIVKSNETLILNLSMSSEYTNKIIVNFLAKQLMKYRNIITSKLNCSKVFLEREEHQWRQHNNWYLSPIRLIIDESNDFIPNNKVLKKVIKKGRNIGFLLVVVSQSLDLSKDVYQNITQLFVGKMKLEEDINLVKKMTATELSPQQFKKTVKGLDKGVFLYFNDDNQHILMKFKPRYTLHPASSQLEYEKKFLIIGEEITEIEKIPEDPFTGNEIFFAGWTKIEEVKSINELDVDLIFNFNEVIEYLGKNQHFLNTIPKEFFNYIPKMKELNLIQIEEGKIAIKT